MADLTAAQIQHLRKDIADAGTKTKLSPDELQQAFDLAEDDLDVTRVICLQWLFAMALPKTPEFNQYERLLAYWTKRAGMQGGELKAGLIDLGIDTDEESEWQ